MAVAPVQVNVCVEVQSLFLVLQGVLSDVKAGKAPGAIVADAVPALVVALQGVAGLPAELADLPDLQNTLALGVVGLLNSLGA